MAAYEKYIDSGIEWLGEIPEHWEPRTIGAIFEYKSEKNYPEENVLSVYRDYGVIQKDSRDDNHNATSLDTSNYKLVKPGYLVVNKMKAWQGSMGISDYTGIVSPAYITCKPCDKGVTSKFIHYLLRSYRYIGEYYRLSYGVRVGQWDMHYEDYKKVELFLPPLAKQEAIANYLDEKCEKIDRAISQKEQLIQLLKERKQILIQNAVTKGLDPDVKMVDSGVEWIGKIPEHWEVKRLKYILSERKERTSTGEEPLFMVSQEYGLVVRSEYHEKAQIAESNIDNKIVYENDLVFNKLKAHLGVFYKSEIEFKGIVSPDYAVYFSKGIIEDLKLLEILFRHPAYIEQFITRATGIVEGLIRLYTDDLFDIKVPVAPTNEQVEILEYITDKTAIYDEAIMNQQSQIDKLKEYKSTLIDSAVTGKIKVV